MWSAWALLLVGDASERQRDEEGETKRKDFFFREASGKPRPNERGRRTPVQKYFRFCLHEAKQNKEHLTQNKQCLDAGFFFQWVGSGEYGPSLFF